jgi:DNA-binding transcriptional MocR family regulator
MTWFPKLPFGEGPRYLQIVAALRNDIQTGAVSAGQQLPTHREMATRLGLSIGTVSKAYAAAERQGLTSGQVGRGTFVLLEPVETGLTSTENQRINLALNAPPDTGEADVVASTLSDIARNGSLSRLLGYLPHQGLESHRKIIAHWLSERNVPATAAGVYITHGAQHAISIAMRLLARPGDTILAENLTYSGMSALALMDGYNLAGVAMDDDGLIPEFLEETFQRTGAKVVYCTPTFQTATGTIMPEERRREIVEVVRRHDGWIVEDDTYGFLLKTPLPTLSSMLPERSFYVTSFAKCLAPGLRVGAMTAPTQFRDRVVNAIRSTGWMANAIMSEVVTKTMISGELEQQINLKRAAATERSLIAQRVLSEHLQPREIPAFHVWLNLPAGRTSSGLVAQAGLYGVTLAPPNPLSMSAAGPDGIRLCLGPAKSPDLLSRALNTVRDILAESEEMALL